MDAIPCPVIRFVPGRAAPPRVVENPGSYDWILFTSPRGVEYFFQWLDVHRRSLSDFSAARFAAIGPATAERLREWGVGDVRVPERAYQAEGLLELFGAESLDGKRVLLPRAHGRPILVDTLRSRGARVDEWEIYRTEPERSLRLRPILKVVRTAGIILFTSPSTFHHFDAAVAAAWSHEAYRAWWDRVDVIAIGPVTAEALRHEGVPVAAEAEQATENDLVRRVIEYAGKDGRHEEMAS